MRKPMFINKSYNGDLMKLFLAYVSVFTILFPIGAYFLYKITRDMNEY